MKHHCAIVFETYVNGYNIIRELHEQGIKHIITIRTQKNIADFSSKITKSYQLPQKNSELIRLLKSISKEYGYLVLFPSDDHSIERLSQIAETIKSFSFLPFNENNVLDCLKKSYQYQIATNIGIPVPQSVYIENITDLVNTKTIQFPIIIKPVQREDKKKSIFRSKTYASFEALHKDKEIIKKILAQNVSFIASEIIPGDGSQVYAYVGYRNHKGIILNEWTGKKLSQYPNDYGVFASASNEAPEIIQTQGRQLLEALDLYGIAEPEFKYDARDGTYKLMEINLRSMMWHRVGNRSGVYLQYTQYLDAIGKNIPQYTQDKHTIMHFIYLKHEVYNLLTRKKYLSTFVYNLFKGKKITWAIFEKKDLLPALVDLPLTFLRLFKKLCARFLKN